MEQDSAEILVHVAAPSRGADDAKYRKEAREILGFEAVVRHDILSLGEDVTNLEKDTLSQRHEQDEGEISGGVDDPPNEEVPSNDSELQSRKARSKSIDLAQPATTTAPLWLTRDVDPVVPQSGPGSVPRVLIERTPIFPPRRPTFVPVTPGAGGPSHRRAVSDSWKTPPSVIPDSQPTPNIRQPFTSSSPSLRRTAVPSSSPSPTKDEENLRSHKRQRTHDDKLMGQESAGEPSFLTRIDASFEQPITHQRSEQLRTLKTLEIHPPRSDSSEHHFDSHLTLPLQTIAKELPMEKYFKPIATTRAAEKLERGHWFLRIGQWEDELRAKFWGFMTKFIEEGRAGWGVWCSREFLGNEEGNEGGKNMSRKEETIRLYGWGEVLGELWVLLFIASERQIEGVGAQWIDADQELVVQMK